MANYDEDKDLTLEAKKVVKEVKPLVRHIALSKTLEHGPTVAHINICTLEDSHMCVRLSVRGYQVVSEQYDKCDQIKDPCYELIDQLLSDKSPGYRQEFSNAVSAKLLNLK